MVIAHNVILNHLIIITDWIIKYVQNVFKLDVNYLIETVNVYNVLMDIDMLIIYVYHVKIYIVSNVKMMYKLVKNVGIIMVGSPRHVYCVLKLIALIVMAIISHVSYVKIRIILVQVPVINVRLIVYCVKVM